MKSKVIKSRKGFTLIEIVVVLVIVGVLAAIALPAFSSWSDRSHAAEGILSMKNIADQLDGCYSKTQNYATCLTQLYPAIPTGGTIAITPYFDIINGGSSGTAAMIYAAWDTIRNPRPPPSSLTVGCAGFSGSVSGYGQIALCTSSGGRSTGSSGIFQGMYSSSVGGSSTTTSTST